MSNEECDCPTCGRPTPSEIDVECHCGMMASHHVSVWTMCKRLRESQQRESALIVQNKKLEDEVNEQARLLGMSAERECDLRGKLERERAIADRLAEVLNKAIEIIPDDAYVAERIEVRRWEKALAAWKEARSE